MAVVAIASAKGGVGKSTVALLLGAEFALDGYKVAILDCDLNQHASAFGKRANLPNLRILPNIEEGAILRVLREAEDKDDIVLVDLPGGSSTLALKALQRSHLVLVPCQSSLPDARDAVKTIVQIDEAEELARNPIARAIIWSRILPGFESKIARHVRASVEGQGAPILKVGIMERAAFRAIHVTGEVPRQADPDGAAAANIAALAREVLSLLEVKEAAA